jgi:hypothetical protein
LKPGEGLAVWLLALGQTLTYSGVYYAFPALLPDLEAATGWSKAALAAGPTLGFLVMAALIPLTGRLVDRGYGGEMLFMLPVLAALAVAALATVRTPGQWLLVWAVIGVAQAGCLYESCFAFLTRRLGLGARAAITKVTLVAGFAGTLTFPLGHLLGEAMGGQGALLAFGGLILLAVPVNFWAVRLLRRGVRLGGERPAPEPGALRAALARVEFWALASVFGLIWLNHGILITYVLPLFQASGAGARLAVLAASCIGPAQVAGRLVLLWGGARIDNFGAAFFSLAAVVVAALVLWLAGVAPGLIFVFALLQGAGAGLLSILRPMLVVEVLGPRGFGAVSGAVAVAPILASAAAPSVGAALLGWGGAGLTVGSCLTMAVVGLGIGVWLARRREG